MVKDTSLSCEWKPGVIAARSVHEVPASEVVGDRSADSPSLPVLNDFVRVESVQPCRRRCFWHGAGNAIPTIIEDYKRSVSLCLLAYGCCLVSCVCFTVQVFLKTSLANISHDSLIVWVINTGYDTLCCR